QTSVLAIVTTLVVGIPACFGLRHAFRGRTAVRGLLLAPLIVPQVITAMAIYYAMSRSDIQSSVVTIGLTQAVLILPVFILIVGGALQKLDTKLEWAASASGANTWQTAVFVILPQ